jgi:ATP-dependent Clp protease ATP-binding subunit ClpA
LSEEQGIDMTFDESAVKKIAELGYDPVFGARPLRNVISEKIRGVLAEKLLKGEIVRGSSIKAVFEDEEFGFKEMG